MIKVIKKPSPQSALIAFQWRNGTYVGELPLWFFEALVDKRLRIGPGGLFAQSDEGECSVLYGDYLVCLGSGEIVIYQEDEFWKTYQQVTE